MSNYVLLYFSLNLYNIEVNETTVNVYPNVMNFIVIEKLSGMNNRNRAMRTAANNVSAPLNKSPYFACR